MEEILKQTKKVYRNTKRQGLTSYDSMMDALESVPNTYGVESLQMRYSSTILYYANTGETYETTVLAWHNPYSQRTTFKLGNWGDLVESGDYV
jgi:hypothetical protein